MVTSPVSGDGRGRDRSGSAQAQALAQETPACSYLAIRSAELAARHRRPRAARKARPTTPTGEGPLAGAGRRARGARPEAPSGHRRRPRERDVRLPRRHREGPRHEAGGAAQGGLRVVLGRATARPSTSSSGASVGCLDDSMRERQTCVGCSRQSPETETNYTLISAQFGWRLTRTPAADGSISIEWRCPTCWRTYRAGRRRTEPQTDEDPEAARPPERLGLSERVRALLPSLKHRPVPPRRR